MPTYEYACDGCGHQMEVFQSIRDERLVQCPQCAENTLRRLIGRGAGIIFKGSGFYQTDYKNTAPAAGEGSKEGAETKPAASPGDASAPKPESKPASTSATK